MLVMMAMPKPMLAGWATPNPAVPPSKSPSTGTGGGGGPAGPIRRTEEALMTKPRPLPGPNAITQVMVFAAELQRKLATALRCPSLRMGEVGSQFCRHRLLKLAAATRQMLTFPLGASPPEVSGGLGFCDWPPPVAQNVLVLSITHQTRPSGERKLPRCSMVAVTVVVAWSAAGTGTGSPAARAVTTGAAARASPSARTSPTRAAVRRALLACSGVLVGPTRLTPRRRSRSPPASAAILDRGPVAVNERRARCRPGTTGHGRSSVQL